MSSPFLSMPLVITALAVTGKKFAYRAGEVCCLFVVRVYVAGGGDVTGEMVLLVGYGVLFFARTAPFANDHHTLALFLVGIGKSGIFLKAQPFMNPIRRFRPFKSFVYFFLIAFLGMEESLYFPIVLFYVNILCVHITDILPT